MNRLELYTTRSEKLLQFFVAKTLLNCVEVFFQAAYIEHE